MVVGVLSGIPTSTMIDKALRIDGWMFEDELTWLAERATESKIAVEIGSWMGRSSRAVGDHIQDKLYCIDYWKGPIRKKYRRARRLFFKNLEDLLASSKIIHIHHNSQLGVPDELKGPIDLLFIDGDHSYEACLSDITHFAPLVRVGGIVSGHDYCHDKHPGVKQAVDEVYGSSIKLCNMIWWIVKE